VMNPVNPVVIHLPPQDNTQPKFQDEQGKHCAEKD
jgi:hypothetical protein